MTECWCDYDPPSFFMKTTPKARKRHICYECGGPVLPGERYEKAVGVWDGSFDTYRTCARCKEIRDFVEGNVPCVCWTFGEMFENAHDAIEAAQGRAPDETRGLHFAYLRRCVALRKFNKANK